MALSSSGKEIFSHTSLSVIVRLLSDELFPTDPERTKSREGCSAKRCDVLGRVGKNGAVYKMQRTRKPQVITAIGPLFGVTLDPFDRFLRGKPAL